MSGMDHDALRDAARAAHARNDEEIAAFARAMAAAPRATEGGGEARQESTRAMGPRRAR